MAASSRSGVFVVQGSSYRQADAVHGPVNHTTGEIDECGRP